MKVYELITKVLERGDFSLSAMEEKINKAWIVDELTDEEKQELLDLAYANVNENAQVDVLAVVHELQERINALEQKLFVEHSETQLYDGGRSYTGLSIGKIDGWFKTDANGTTKPIPSLATVVSMYSHR